MPDPVVSVILPVYNQADHIVGVVESYLQAISRIPYSVEFVLVVNHSRDNSLEICTELAQKYPSVRVIHSEKGGWGLAVRLGLREARGGWLCYTNSARTRPQDLLLLLLYGMANPGSIVKAHRHSRESLIRKVGSFLYNLQCRALFDLATWDINATPKVFSRDIYNSIQPQFDNDLLDLEVYLKCQQQNVIVLEVPVYASARHGGKSTTNFRSAFKMYWSVFKIWWVYRRHKRFPEMSQ